MRHRNKEAINQNNKLRKLKINAHVSLVSLDILHQYQVISKSCNYQ